MQYQRHNFAGNFLNAVETDKPGAWDILINEINEIILEHPKEVHGAIVRAGLKLPPKATAKDKLDVIHDNIYSNEGLRNSLLRLVAHRHKDDMFSADGGEFDNVMIEGEAQKDFNMTGESMQDEGTMNFVFQGATRLAQGVREKTQIAKNKIQAAQNLRSKEQQRNIPVSRNSGKMSPGAIIGISVAAVAVISLIGYLVYTTQKKASAS